MKGVAIEGWDLVHEARVKTWLQKLFGPQDMNVWYIDQDFDLWTLVMREDIYLLYHLKWRT